MKLSINFYLITAIFLSLELARHCFGCNMSHMRTRALRACDDFASRIRQISNEELDPTLAYRIISVPANRTDRSVGHHRRLAKIITKDDFPENGYLVVYHPYTKYFRSAKEQQRYYNYKVTEHKSHDHLHHHKHHHHHHRQPNSENEILKDTDSKNSRPKRYIDEDPSVSYCCSNPADMEVCHDLICFHFK